MRSRHFAAEPGTGKKNKREGEDCGSRGEGHVEVAIGVIDVVVAGKVPEEQRDNGAEAGGEEGEEARGQREKERGEESEVAEGDAEEFSGLGGSSHSASSLSGFVMNFRDTPLEYRLMAGTAQIPLYSAAKVAQEAKVREADNGMCWATFGEVHNSSDELEKIVQAVPAVVAAALRQRAWYFVPLAIGEDEETVVAPDYTVDLGDRAICHRNVRFGGSECIFISTRLMQDRFALAFEFLINVGHHFVDVVGVPQSFADLAWSQASTDVRGETSQDAWESRRRALDRSRGNEVDERAKTSYFESTFADALAIYMLSLTVDFDYADLREREYPLLAAPALAERLRHVAEMFPPNAGYEFEIRYRRRV